MLKIQKIISLSLTAVMAVFGLFGCDFSNDSSSINSDSSSSDSSNVETIVTTTVSTMLEGEAEETEVYKFTTNKSGPKIVIVGGIHGDEIAGWTAATDLITEIPNMENICGEVLLIPKANKLADNKKVRYYVSSLYSDLNRSFEVGRVGTPKANTLKMSNAIVEVITNFVGETYDKSKPTNLCIIDLHESKHAYNYDDGEGNHYLGNELIFSNNSLFMIDNVLERYNTVYRETDELLFSNESASKDGSFSKYFTTKYKKATVFTIETNRELDLSVRVRQQKNILNALFDYAWGKITY